MYILNLFTVRLCYKIQNPVKKKTLQTIDFVLFCFVSCFVFFCFSRQSTQLSSDHNCCLTFCLWDSRVRSVVKAFAVLHLGLSWAYATLAKPRAGVGSHTELEGLLLLSPNSLLQNLSTCLFLGPLFSVFWPEGVVFIRVLVHNEASFRSKLGHKRGERRNSPLNGSFFKF